MVRAAHRGYRGEDWDQGWVFIINRVSYLLYSLALFRNSRETSDLNLSIERKPHYKALTQVPLHQSLSQSLRNADKY